MEPTDRGDVIAVRGDVEARLLSGSEEVDDALALLDAAGSAVAAPLVDEAERARLEGLVSGRTPRVPNWRSLLARRGGEVVGYAGLLLPTGPDGVASGDVATARDERRGGSVLAVLLEGVAVLASGHGADRLQVWIRHAASSDLDRAAGVGYGIERRLGVLARRLDDVSATAPQPPSGITIRGYRPDEDDEAVVAVLAEAYAGTADAGWTLERFRERRAYDWFRAADLLVAEAGDGDLRGIHWLKRRGAGVGEVYNLAIAPAAQGTGLGAALLTAGLAHLAAAGLDEVLLWVDLANDPAVRLYTSQGFRTRWEDVALGRDLSARTAR